MSFFPTTPLDGWVARKIGLAESHSLTRSVIRAYQLEKLNDTLARARRNSPFYNQWLRDIPPKGLSCLQDIERIPFTRARDIRRNPLALLCVSQDRVARIVTLQFPEILSPPKRLFFTEADLELTVDFFHHGMAILATPGQRVMILLPGDLPGSVGDLLARALKRMDIESVVHGPVQNEAATLEAIQKERIDCLVGIPVQVLSLARHEKGASIGSQNIKNVLLSSDYVPQAVVEALLSAWNCRVFQHYGMTEMGFGGGVECAIHQGYHLCEADLFFEIIDPQTENSLPAGTPGEVVFTTLTREGMPLIRYRTGDMAAIIPDPCPCGSALQRLSTIREKRDAAVALEGGCHLRLSDLDEALFSVAGLTDYEAAVDRQNGKDRLTITVHKNPDGILPDMKSVKRAVMTRLPISRALHRQRIIVNVIQKTSTAKRGSSAVKRKIIDYRKKV